ncbi:unnamed protein product [Soboliphyme baturini]|uniref:C2H2-type domain-containing protein n=1 Tax=Soboliphyme baturini TaxID=241478 RepID=A0A183IXS1_9BILA|nr:unnamed protein product [Soboliphyme baturini]
MESKPQDQLDDDQRKCEDHGEVSRRTRCFKGTRRKFSVLVPPVPVKPKTDDETSGRQSGLTQQQNDSESQPILVVLPEGVEDEGSEVPVKRRRGQSSKTEVQRTFLAEMAQLPMIERMASNENCDLVNKHCLAGACRRQFNTFEELAYHLSMSHHRSQQGPSTVQCLVCGREEEAYLALLLHLLSDHADVAPRAGDSPVVQAATSKRKNVE